MNKVASLTVWGLVIAAGLGAVAFFLPLPISGLSLSETGQKVLLAVSVVYLAQSIGAVLLFALGRRSLKPELKRSYSILSIGVVLFAVAQFQTPLAVTSGFQWWITSGLVVLPYLFSSYFAFWGVRNFAQLVGLTDRWTHFRFVLPLVAVLTVAAFFLPIRLSTIMPSEIAFHIFRSLSIWEIVLGGCTAYNAWRIKKIIGPLYQEGMRWLFATFAAYVVVNAHFWALQQIGYDNWYGRNSIELITLTLVGLLFVRTGYAFWAIVGKQNLTTRENASPLDVIFYTASLVSNPKEIDPILDTVRGITVNIVDAKTLTPEQQEALSTVYQQLEAYLIKKEPLRDFTKPALRKEIAARFPQHQTTNSTFWKQLTV